MASVPSGVNNGQLAQSQIKTLAETLLARRSAQAPARMKERYLNYLNPLSGRPDAESLQRKSRDAKEYADRILMLEGMEHRTPNAPAAEKAYMSTTTEAQRVSLIRAADSRLAALIAARAQSQQPTPGSVPVPNAQPAQNLVQPQPARQTPTVQPAVQQPTVAPPRPAPTVQPAAVQQLPIQQPIVAPLRPAPMIQRRTVARPSVVQQPERPAAQQPLAQHIQQLRASIGSPNTPSDIQITIVAPQETIVAPQETIVAPQEIIVAPQETKDAELLSIATSTPNLSPTQTETQAQAQTQAQTQTQTQAQTSDPKQSETQGNNCSDSLEECCECCVAGTGVCCAGCLECTAAACPCVATAAAVACNCCLGCTACICSPCIAGVLWCFDYCCSSSGTETNNNTNAQRAPRQ